VYRAPASLEGQASRQASPLPTLAELTALRGASLTAAAGDLRALFSSVVIALSDDLGRSIGMMGSVVYGAAVSSALAVVVGLARLGGAPEGSPLLVFAFVVGTLYGVVRVVTWKIRWVDKRSGQSITGAMPLVVGFGYGLVSFGIEALFSLVPVVPTVVPTLLATAGFVMLWRSRYRERFPGLDERIPFIGVSSALLRMADANATATVSWADPSAPRTTPETYRASVHLPEGARVTCACYTHAASLTLEVVAEFPAGFVWIHPTERVSFDGLTLEVTQGPTGSVVRTTNTHAPGTPMLFAKAITVSLAACRRA
jgi:hypothetical protein